MLRDLGSCHRRLMNRRSRATRLARNGHWSRKQSREFVTELEGELLSVLREAVGLFIASYPPPHRLQKEILSRSPSLPPPQPPPSAPPSSYVRCSLRSQVRVCLSAFSAKAERKRHGRRWWPRMTLKIYIFTFRNKKQSLTKKIRRLLRDGASFPSLSSLSFIATVITCYLIYHFNFVQATCVKIIWLTHKEKICVWWNNLHVNEKR